jgi:meiotically up-regulated gene 157 (Mug157) protein
VFQLDQQCYPLLELAEYALQFAQPGNEGWEEEREFVGQMASKAVDEVLACLQEHRWTAGQTESKLNGAPAAAAQQLWLFKTDETPADDEVAYPYHFSSHILLWRALESLAKLQALIEPGIITTPVGDWAKNVHAATLQHFTTTHPVSHKPMFAYLTSTTGQYQFYHDANDLPTALAPDWGFCAADSEAWANTLEFAFSTLNEGGYYPGGPYGGLGSVHTRDPWPLGDGQRLAIIATTGGKRARQRDEVLDKIVSEAQWDGLFSEAVNRDTGVVTSKHWFSWPGSFISSILVSRHEELFPETST